MKRRRLLAGVGGIAALGAAGCLDTVGMAEHEASPAGVDPDVRAETGYEQVNIEERVIEEPFEVAGVSEEVSVTNYLTEHEKSVELGPMGSVQAAAFVVLTSPQISIAGQELNPIAEMDSEELIELIEAGFDDISDVQHRSDEETSVLEQETTESIFEAEATFNGFAADVNIHITESVQTTDDHLVTIGVYPKQLQDAESDNIAALREGLVENID